MHPTKLSSRDPVLDRPSPHPQNQELPTSNNPVLTLSEVSNPIVNRTKRGFSMPDMGNRRFVGHRADDPRPKRTRGALIGTSCT
jgi:hypothetical protein